jgi:hypothetical protein
MGVVMRTSDRVVGFSQEDGVDLDVTFQDFVKKRK